MAFDVNVNTDIARQLGILGANETAGGGIVQQRLDSPQYAHLQSAYEALRKQQDPTYKFVSTVTPASQNVPVTNQMSINANNPSLPYGSTLIPAVQTVQPGELQTYTPMAAVQAAPATTVNTPVVAPAVQGQAQTVDPNAATAGLDPNAAKYTASTVAQNTPQATAEQGDVAELATIQGQLKKLYGDTQDGKVPLWAQGAVAQGNDLLAARGLGASTIGAAAITSAVQQSALNIAAPDAATYFQMDLTNLNNRQQTSLANLQARQQFLLSDQAAENAAKQFNASSDAQMQQFTSSLVAQIQSQNADRVQAMSQFNAGETNKANQFGAQIGLQAETFNAEQKNALNTFNAQLQFQREQFNATNQFAVEQSNVLWRRAINTGNTASINAANQTNVQNMYNMSATALNNLWQQFRDESSWMFSASENEKNRQFNAAMAANNRQYLEDQSEPNYWNLAASAAGSFASSLFS